MSNIWCFHETEEYEGVAQRLLDCLQEGKFVSEVAQEKWGLTEDETVILEHQLNQVKESQKLQQLGMDQIYDTFHFKTEPPSFNPDLDDTESRLIF